MARPTAGVADIGCASFAWAVDHAAHDGNRTIQRAQDWIGVDACFEFANHRSDVVGSAATGRATDDFRAVRTKVKCLENTAAGDDFIGGRAGERDAEGVTDAFGEKDGEADGRFYEAACGGTGFGDADMKGVIAALGENAIGLDGSQHRGGFDAKDNVTEAGLFEEGSFAESAFGHGAAEGAATGVHVIAEIGLEAAGVDTDADRNVAFSGSAGDGLDAVRAADVARVDAQFSDAVAEGGEGEAVIEVDVGDQGEGRGGDDFGEGVRSGGVGDSHADDVTAEVSELADLGEGGGDIARVGGSHRLDGDRVGRTDEDRADADSAGEAAWVEN